MTFKIVNDLRIYRFQVSYNIDYLSLSSKLKAFTNAVICSVLHPLLRDAIAYRDIIAPAHIMQ